MVDGDMLAGGGGAPMIQAWRCGSSGWKTRCSGLRGFLPAWMSGCASGDHGRRSERPHDQPALHLGDDHDDAGRTNRLCGNDRRDPAPHRRALERPDPRFCPCAGCGEPAIHTSVGRKSWAPRYLGNRRLPFGAAGFSCPGRRSRRSRVDRPRRARKHCRTSEDGGIPDGRRRGARRKPAHDPRQRRGRGAARRRPQAHPRPALHRTRLRPRHLARDGRDGLARLAPAGGRRRFRPGHVGVLRAGRGTRRRPGARAADPGRDGGKAAARRSPVRRAVAASASSSPPGRSGRTAWIRPARRSCATAS